jgi:hypothetical protein
MPNYGPRADYGAVTDCNSAQNTDAGANPHVRPDPHWPCHARLFINATLRKCTMVVIRYKTTWRNYCMISNHNTISNIEFSSGAQVTKLSNLNISRI